MPQGSGRTLGEMPLQTYSLFLKIIVGGLSLSTADLAAKPPNINFHKPIIYLTDNFNFAIFSSTSATALKIFCFSCSLIELP